MCPSCNSQDISRSRKKKLRDIFMRWMGKVPYRCRDCQKRFYVGMNDDRRLRSDREWRRRSEENATGRERSPVAEDPNEDE